MKKLIGTVVSTKMQKTAVVKVDAFWRHPIYGKRVKKTKKYLAHDELGVKEGERVKIGETRPISKRKRWRVIEAIR